MGAAKGTLTEHRRPAGWRRRAGIASTALGSMLLVGSCCTYLRYASDPGDLHVQERLRYAQALGVLWSASFFGALLLMVVALCGTGWGRWSGLAFNVAALLCALTTLGALCGPFGCS